MNHDPPTMQNSESPQRVQTRPAQPVWSAIIAWLVILAMATDFIRSNLDEPTEPKDQQAADEAEPAGPDVKIEVVGRVLVGAGHSFPEYRALLASQTSDLDEAGFTGRLCAAVVVGELEGPDKALERLAALADDVDAQRVSPSTHELEAREALGRLYEDLKSEQPDLPSISSADRENLAAQLGWFGKLVLLPEGGPDTEARNQMMSDLARVPLALVGFLVWASLWGLAGLAILVVLAIQLLLRNLRDGFGPRTDHGVIYAETFALWMLLYGGMRWSISMLEPRHGIVLINIVIVILGLLALLWPIIRGLRWSQMRDDLGLRCSRGVAAEALAGLATYAMAIPITVAGLLLTVVLLAIEKHVAPHAPAPGHPVQQMIAGAGWIGIAGVFVLGAVVAPIAEEIMFRGVLYRHLRDMTAGTGRVLSIILSAGTSSVLFAAIHPQGWPFIPVLGALAVTFCLAREWRGSVLPGIIAHGLNNAVILALNVILFSGG